MQTYHSDIDFLFNNQNNCLKSFLFLIINYCVLVLSKSKTMKRIRQKSRKSSKHFREHIEYETNRMKFGRLHQQVPRIPSDNSVIYVKSYPHNDNIPIIDLTKTSHMAKSKFPRTASLNQIYKPNNCHNKNQKPLTTLVLTIPLRRSLGKIRNASTTSNLTRCSKDKLSILDIPREFFDEDTDGNEYTFYDLSKADLNEEDRSMIECIAMKEDGNECTYNLESTQYIQSMCKLYGITSEDNFQ